MLNLGATIKTTSAPAKLLSADITRAYTFRMSAASDVGILAMEMYVPTRFVDQKDLECSGQFGQIRSLQQEWQSRSADELDRCGNMPSA